MIDKRLIASSLLFAGLLGAGVTGQIHADTTQDSSTTTSNDDTTTDDSYSDIPDAGITVTNDVDDSTDDSTATSTTTDSNADQESTDTDEVYNADIDSSNNGYATYESRNRLYHALETPRNITNRGNLYDDWSKIYTKKSYNNLDKAYYQALKINRESNPTQADVDKAYAQLKQALTNLEKYKGSKEQKAVIAKAKYKAKAKLDKAKAKLLKTIKQAKSKTNKGYPKYKWTKGKYLSGGRYNYFRFKDMQKALRKASKAYKNSKVSVKSVNKANKKLKRSLKNLVDQKAYYKAIKKYESDSLYNYTVPTAATWSMVTDDLYEDYDTDSSIYDFTQKDLDYDIKMFYGAVKRLHKHHWRKDTNKLWGKINKKTGKFYYNRDRWGRKVTRYYYDKKDKHHKHPYSYELTIEKKHETQYIVYRLDTNDMVALRESK